MVRDTFSDRERSFSFPHLPRGGEISFCPRSSRLHRPPLKRALDLRAQKKNRRLLLVWYVLIFVQYWLLWEQMYSFTVKLQGEFSKKCSFSFSSFLNLKVVFKKELKFPYYISSRIFYNIIAKWIFLRRTVFFGQKLFSKVAIIKTKSATPGHCYFLFSSFPCPRYFLILELLGLS